MTGNTLYWMQGDGMAETIATYRYLNRSVWVQELDLTPAERLAVRDFIAWNARPENRYYRYDYYLDNCSTRVRDLIDRVVGGQLKPAMSSRLTNTTYRFHTQRALAVPNRAVALGTNIGARRGGRSTHQRVGRVVPPGAAAGPRSRRAGPRRRTAPRIRS